jgi:hypothetical protein
MDPVNIMGQPSPCSYKIAGVWSATMAGLLNTGAKPAGGCMCTAGTTDAYESVVWAKKCYEGAKWCDALGNGNGCPEKNTTITGATVSGFKAKCASQDSTFSNKMIEAMNLQLMRHNMKLGLENEPAQAVRMPDMSAVKAC